MFPFDRIPYTANDHSPQQQQPQRQSDDKGKDLHPRDQEDGGRKHPQFAPGKRRWSRVDLHRLREHIAACGFKPPGRSSPGYVTQVDDLAELEGTPASVLVLLDEILNECTQRGEMVEQLMKDLSER